MHGSSPSSWSGNRRGDGPDNTTGSFNNSSYSGSKMQNFSRPPRREEFKAYVKNVPLHITKESLETFFRSCGNVVSCNVVEPKEGRNSTIGFVGFASEEELNNAIQTINGTLLGDNQLSVERAIQRDRGAGTPRRGQENHYQGKTDFQHSSGFQSGQSPYQGYRTKQYEQPAGSRHNYMQQPGAMPNQRHNMPGVKVEQAIFNPRGPGRGIPMQPPGPYPVPGRDSNYMNGPTNDFSSNQGPQQWNQANSVDNQHMAMSGQMPQGTMPQEVYNQHDQHGQMPQGTMPQEVYNQHNQHGQMPQGTMPQGLYNQHDQHGQMSQGTMPQEPYNQQDQHGQFQNGPVNSGSWTNQEPQQWNQANSIDNQHMAMSGQMPQGTMLQEPYNQQDQHGQFQNGPVNSGSWTNQGQWNQANSIDNQHMAMSGQMPQGTMPQEPYNQQDQHGQMPQGTIPQEPYNQQDQHGQMPQGTMPQEPYNQQDQHGQMPQGTIPQEPYNQQDQHGQFQNGPVDSGSWTNQGPQQWNQANSVDNQHMAMSGRLPYSTMPQEPYAQQEQQPPFQKGGQSCHKCGEVGHFARECPTQGGQRGNQRLRGDQSCYKCGETGHFSRECTSSGVMDKTCRNCGGEGHFARECPAVGNASSPGQKGDQSCYNCGETGHFSRECPSSGGTENRAPPVTYIPPELPANIDELFQDAPHSGLNFDKYDDIPVQVTGKDPVQPISTFEEAGILEQCSANIKRAQFIKPTPIQKYAIPIALQGRDLMACAQTGSGKTVAFLVPVLTTMVKQGHLSGGFLSGETQAPSALCVAPTRELAMQIYKEVRKFSDGTVVTAAVCYGGVSVQYQRENIRRGCHILVATPGRLHDFVSRNWISLADVRYLILDEADRMLDMGFEPEIRKLVERCGMPGKANRQTLMFSATFPDEIQRLAADFLKVEYLFVAVGRIGGSNLDISQTVISVPGDDKQEKLFEILLNSGTDRTLIFVELKRVADFLACLLSQNNFPTTSISGDRTQQEREAALRDFRSGRAPVLVATSVAARGLDIPDVKHVINFDLPQDIEEYVHRIGRTGRIGNKGKATSFFQPGKDERVARSLVKVLSEAYQDVPEWLEQVAEEAIGSSYGPAGGKFASKDRREREHFAPRSSADVMEPVNRGMARLDVNAHNQARPSQNSNSAAASYQEDEEEWD